MLAITLVLASLFAPLPAEDEGGAGAKLQMLTLTARMDGSGVFTFTDGGLAYEHKHWRRPTDVALNGRAWETLEETPEEWAGLRGKLDLSEAWIVKRSGRDIIGLEKTAKGFMIFIADSPNDADDYEVTIAIPLKP
jgi:hypothetical protein